FRRVLFRSLAVGSKLKSLCRSSSKPFDRPIASSEGLDMLAPMSERAGSTRDARDWRRMMRAEFALLIGLGTAAIFFAAGSRLVEIIAHPVAMIVVFLWLFAVIFWS